MLVDLPGYGFAKRSGREREDWGRLVDDYFGRSQTLGHLLLLCDIRHDASQGESANGGMAFALSDSLYADCYQGG